MTQSASTGRWREGWSSPSGGPEISGAWAPEMNTGGDIEAASGQTGASFSKIRKRSYKRAVRRAQLQGETMYRGRRLVSRAPMLPVIEEQMQTQARRRIRFLSWNVGGLSDVLFTELQQWLQKTQNKDINIIILQETHWDFSGDWSTKEWHFLPHDITAQGQWRNFNRGSTGACQCPTDPMA